MLHTVQIVEIDTDPFDAFYDREPTLRADYVDLPEPFLTALRLELLDKPEEAVCAECNTGVGYYLEEGDEGGLEHAYWHWTTMVAVPGGPIALLCEDHTPFVPDGP